VELEKINITPVICDSEPELMQATNALMERYQPRFVCGLRCQKWDFATLRRIHNQALPSMPWLTRVYLIDLRDLFAWTTRSAGFDSDLRNIITDNLPPEHKATLGFPVIDLSQLYQLALNSRPPLDVTLYRADQQIYE
jgi:hypothetical protein